jgi:hypothetical protein
MSGFGCNVCGYRYSGPCDCDPAKAKPTKAKPTERKPLTKKQARAVAGAWLYAMTLGDDPDSDLLTPDEQSLVADEARNIVERFAIPGATSTLDEIITAVTGRS